MSILDQIKGALGGGGGDDGGNPVMGALESIMDQKGGISGLVGALKGGGLGDAVQSWMGKGDNVPVTGDQIKGALPDVDFAALAGKFGGGDEAGLLSKIADFLPNLMDKLSPEGLLPEDGAIGDAIKGVLGKLFK